MEADITGFKQFRALRLNINIDIAVLRFFLSGGDRTNDGKIQVSRHRWRTHTAYERCDHDATTPYALATYKFYFCFYYALVRA
jgi:hypothetical protein